MTSEQQARIQIDLHLKAAGWIGQDAYAVNSPPSLAKT